MSYTIDIGHAAIRDYFSLPSLPSLVSIAILSLPINLLSLALPLYVLQIFDRVLTSHSIDTLLVLALFTALFSLILWSLEIVRSRMMFSLGKWFKHRFAGEALAATLRVGLDQRRSSIQPVRDIDVVCSFLTGPSIFPILDAPWSPVFLAVVFLIHPLLGWIGLAGLILLLVFALINDLATRGSLVRAAQFSGFALDEAQAAARNSDVIEAMGMMHNLVSRWTVTIDESLMEQASASRLSGLITASSKFVRQLLHIGILAAGAWLVLSNELTPGSMIAGFILMARASAPVEQIIASWRDAIGTRAAYNRIKRMLSMAAQSDAAVPLPKPEGNVSAEDVGFAYPDKMEPFLHNISFELKPGESLGLIGPVGSGKTTLARILVGTLKPQFGHARLDGVIVAEWDARDRGQYLGYLPQDTELFNGTVRENIARLGQGDAEGVHAAARVAGTDEDILAFPEGYDTEIGVGGMALSGGQRQRIGLARAVYGDPVLVVLDEPDSNLDAAGEMALLKMLAHLRENRSTVVIITHRRSVLIGVDKILALRNGTVDMFGPRDKVLAQLGGAREPSSKTKRRSRLQAKTSKRSTP